MLGRLRRFLLCSVLVTISSIVSVPNATAQAAGEPLTLDAAFARALTSNPMIAAARLRRAIDLAGIDVAGERPNPEAHAEVEKETPKQSVRAGAAGGAWRQAVAAHRPGPGDAADWRSGADRDDPRHPDAGSPRVFRPAHRRSAAGDPGRAAAIRHTRCRCGAGALRGGQRAAAGSAAGAAGAGRSGERGGFRARHGRSRKNLVERSAWPSAGGQRPAGHVDRFCAGAGWRRGAGPRPGRQRRAGGVGPANCRRHRQRWRWPTRCGRPT